MSRFVRRFQTWPYRVFLAVIGLFLAGRRVVQAGDNTYSCTSTANKCKGTGDCSGDTAKRSGCSVTCYDNWTNPETNQIELSEVGSASCPSSGS
jgi:hypothetical protein